VPQNREFDLDRAQNQKLPCFDTVDVWRSTNPNVPTVYPYQSSPWAAKARAVSRAVNTELHCASRDRRHLPQANYMKLRLAGDSSPT